MAELSVAEPGWMQTPRLRRPVFEYARVPWDEVTARGAEGWRLVPVDPIQEVKMTLGQPQPGDLLYTMERET